MSSRKGRSPILSLVYAVWVLTTGPRWQSSRKARLGILAATLIVAGMLAGAAPPPLDDLLSWENFLHLMVTPGGVSLGVGILLSIGYEYIPGLPKLSKKMSRLVFFGFCELVPLLAAALGILTLAWPATWGGTFWPALVTGVFVFGSGTLTHTPKLPETPEPQPAPAEGKP
jgi:hypothetical protein